MQAWLAGCTVLYEGGNSALIGAAWGKGEPVNVLQISSRSPLFYRSRSRIAPQHGAGNTFPNPSSGPRRQETKGSGPIEGNDPYLVKDGTTTSVFIQDVRRGRCRKVLVVCDPEVRRTTSLESFFTNTCTLAYALDA